MWLRVERNRGTAGVCVTDSLWLWRIWMVCEVVGQEYVKVLEERKRRADRVVVCISCQKILNQDSSSDSSEGGEEDEDDDDGILVD